jgi:hypothetical protein
MSRHRGTSNIAVFGVFIFIDINCVVVITAVVDVVVNK